MADKFVVRGFSSLLLLSLVLRGGGAATQKDTPKLDEPFHVIWQLPTGVWCPERGIDVRYDEILQDTGITWNANDVWHKGDYSTILYRNDFGYWPHYLHGEEPPINDGIPQLGNLTKHLQGIRQAINTAIPNEDYHGIVCINMEQFRPLYSRNWGLKTVYKTKSKELVEEKFKHLNPSKKWIEDEAIRDFEYHAKEYMMETLRTSNKMRPNGEWGYYNYPYCYNGSPVTLHCREGVQHGNDEMRWLWESSSAIMPSTYVHSESHDDYEAAQFMYGNIEEGRRVADMVGGRPVYSYHKIAWNGTSPVIFYRQITMLNGMRLPADFGVDGVILWGSSGYLRTKFDCERTYNFIKTVVAPYASSLVEFTKLCSETRCSSYGRCVHRGTLDEQYVDEVLRTTMEQLTDWTIDERYSCRCFKGHSGDDCSVSAYTSSGHRTKLSASILLSLFLFFTTFYSS